MGGVQQVFFKARLQLREFLLQFPVPVLFRLFQVYARKVKVAQSIVDDLLPGHVKPCIFLALHQGFASAEQVFILTQFRVMVGHFRNTGIIGAAQCFVICNRMQVAHGGPGALQLVVLFFQGLEQRFPGMLAWFFQQGPQQVAVFFQQLIDGRLNMFRPDAAERRQGQVFK